MIHPTRYRWLCVLTVAASALFNTPCSGYFLGNRWSETAINGPGLQQGDATTITWGFVADGTPQSNSFIGESQSDFISFLDRNLGAGDGGSDLTQRPWFRFFEESFDRWAQLSGLSYVYEPNDDGVEFAAQQDHAVGELGVRADVRIGGLFVDGGSGILAYNFFPDNGDMTFDTGDPAFYSSTTNDFRAIRNVTMHEHGHGIGLNHVITNASMLMNPTFSGVFDGPQFDDVLGAHRGYGDFNEKSNDGLGNDVIGNATELGFVTATAGVEIGLSARRGRLRGQSDFVSIDDDSDVDWFSFTVGAGSTVDVNLTASGISYLLGPQGGSTAPFDASELSNLQLAVFDSDQTTLLGMDDSGGLGGVDSVTGLNLDSGTYYIRVTGEADEVQFFEIAIDVAARGDFDGNQLWDCADIDALVAQVAGGSGDPAFDLDADGAVDQSDIDLWLGEAGSVNLDNGNPYLRGDADLNGVVDISDFNIWNGSKFDPAAAGWCHGDFNADGGVDVGDFNVWNESKFQSSDDPASVVPEPGGMSLLVFGVGALLAIRRRSFID